VNQIHPQINQQVHLTGSGDPSCEVTLSDATTNFHTYSLIWSVNSLVWQIDGVTTCTQTGPTVVSSHPMFLLIQTELGGAFGGTIDPNTLPQAFTIDSVKVWQ
jgi:beta-glucanase (GH16 family)